MYQLLGSDHTREDDGAHLNDDPASEWRDDVYPYRPSEPWDISTDFPYPRLLHYEVSEGTWLRLDVHPLTGDVVFDMVGDLYCLPALSYHFEGYGSQELARAVPILRGVPFDSEPHFSPSGDKLLFTSDAELGFENIWVMPWTGCESMDLGRQSLELETSYFAGGKNRRLLSEGRLNARRATNETYNYVTEARFHPSSDKIIAVKRHYGKISIGAGEGWVFDVPSVTDSAPETPISAGSGARVVTKDLPPGWPKADYPEHFIGPEEIIWAGYDKVIFAKNTWTAGSIQDIHKGIYAIYSKNLTSGEVNTVVDAFPGGASRPTLSQDGRSLAFVRRDRDTQVLVVKDLETGTIHHVWNGLTVLVSMVGTPIGTYPSFAFTPSNDGIIIWATGNIYFVPLVQNRYGERVAGGEPRSIPFKAQIEKRLAETLHHDTDLLPLETKDEQHLYALKELSVNHGGTRAVFQAAGVSYVQTVGDDSSRAHRVPVLYPDEAYYSPSFVPGYDDLVIHAHWSNAKFTTLEIANVSSQSAIMLSGVPKGRYYAPTLSQATSTIRRLAFVKTSGDKISGFLPASGDVLTGSIVATSRPGLYIGEVTLPHGHCDATRQIAVEELRFVRSDVDTTDPLVSMQFVDSGGCALLVQQSQRVFTIDLCAGPDVFGNYPHETIAAGRGTEELVVVPRTAGENYTVDKAAFVHSYNVYLADGGDVSPDEPLWSRPGNATKGLARLSVDGGHDVAFSGDGKKILWLLGPHLHWLDHSDLNRCSREIKKDQNTFGVDCIKDYVKVQDVTVHYTTDIGRLKQDAKAAYPGNSNAAVVAIYNATILSMEHGDEGSDLIYEGTILVRDGVIEAVGNDVVIPLGAARIDAHGGYVVPGFIDAHAHWIGHETRYPAASWEHQTFLAYGVTTVHNPSSHSVLGFVERGRIESGLMVGPRVFHTGRIIYTASHPQFYQDVSSEAEARSALARIKAEGGPASFSYKNYNIQSRAARQRLLKQARNMSMLCMPEGGSIFNWDLTYILDGMTTLEHNLPVPVLYEDVRTLFEMSGTASTPTHIVTYGGGAGEELVWRYYDVPNDPKLREFTRHDILERLSESMARPMNSYGLFNVSESVAKMVNRGLRVHIGAHGEPPLGLNYHAEMFFAYAGGMTSYQVLQAATASPARTFGLWGSLGSVTPGKLADMVIYPPGVDLLADITRTKDLKYVMRGGRIWDADTITEVWPVKGRRQVMPPLNP
ncbi:composite domain of metallo-dependent hydrolase [Coniophora puteana RWD-64-598 SS2]|uniref:Composite domain of metallo-dependent hydrolase n=1 Tax=Coniophora puteana (strain RWD-64-598) TaxID=741705 RepID=A0A5M3MF21_CONPW|nr:composite domain of metallo-dependent hydrolase [Coniophora puteana RWD-64-598 SS2]EIW77828.1 composite domain of metallo-dependent hydrolase [Coniophora puteana RWD-64-598 SS2]